MLLLAYLCRYHDSWSDIAQLAITSLQNHRKWKHVCIHSSRMNTVTFTNQLSLRRDARLNVPSGVAWKVAIIKTCPQLFLARTCLPHLSAVDITHVCSHLSASSKSSQNQQARYLEICFLFCLNQGFIIYLPELLSTRVQTSSLLTALATRQPSV